MGDLGQSATEAGRQGRRARQRADDLAAADQQRQGVPNVDPGQASTEQVEAPEHVQAAAKGGHEMVVTVVKRASRRSARGQYRPKTPRSGSVSLGPPVMAGERRSFHR
jgi:hypothetical protein